MQVELSDSKAHMTGAGCGNAIATELVANGADVVVNDVDRDALDATVAEIEDDGGLVLGVRTDLCDEAEVEAIFEHASAEFGPIDILVNNAGIGEKNLFVNRPDDNLWELNLVVNIKSAISCSKQALKGMLEEDEKIVNVTSTHTENGSAFPQYDVSKFGLLGLMKILAIELAREGIQVNAVRRAGSTPG